MLSRWTTPSQLTLGPVKVEKMQEYKGMAEVEISEMPRLGGICKGLLFLSCRKL